MKKRQLEKSIDLRLNLKRFDGADSGTGIDENRTTDAGMSVEMKEFYSKVLIEEAGPNLIHNQFGVKRPIPKNNGKTISFRKYDSLPKAMKPLEEGVTPKGNKMNITEKSTTVNQYGDWIGLTDILQITTIDNNVVEATKLNGQQAGLTLDSVTRESLAGGTNVYYAPKSDGTAVLTRKNLDASCKITLELLIDVAAALKTAHAPKIDGSYVSIVHPYVAADIMKLEGWQDWQKYTTAENLFEGEIGKIAGIRFVETSEAKIWKDDTCPDGLAVFGTLVLGGNAYGVTEIEGGGLKHIIKQLGYGDDPLNQRSSVGWKATSAALRLIEQYMMRIESVTSKSAVVDAN
ncbi:MAG: N4-gp56 family major capsid protein [Lachnospiraceae bacterium]|nr:N4-gp56 family major capsid protein [Lachnospiraceae bacterium]